MNTSMAAPLSAEPLCRISARKPMKTIFVSSTYQDLSPYRRAIWNLLEEFDVRIRGMEEFGARTEKPLETCIAEVEQSDIYLGVIAFRLGSIEETTRKSYTQLEYERAVELGKEVLVYLVDEENALFPVKYIDRDYKWEKLEAFKSKLRDNHTVDTFVSEDDLVEKLRRDLRRHLDRTTSQEESRDEYEEASDAITKFLLVPKLMSGREVRVDLIISGEPFAASREMCHAFNLPFGATVGVSVNIMKPKGFKESGLKHLFVPPKLIDVFLPVYHHEKRSVFAKLEFADVKISDVQTRFSPTKTEVPAKIVFDSNEPDIPDYIPARTIHHPAEGKVILLLTKTVLDEDSA